MFIVTSKVKCEFCGVIGENTTESSYAGHGSPLPKGWMSYREVTVCPECQQKHTIAEMRQKNKEANDRLEAQEKERGTEDDY